MGGCCSCTIGRRFEGLEDDKDEGEGSGYEEEELVLRGDLGAHVRLRGSSRSVSMHSRQGRKGPNQDAMTVWENFGGDKDMIFCGVFDGHGPSGHKVAQYARDLLPSKLSTSSSSKNSNSRVTENVDDGCNNGADKENGGGDHFKDPFFLSWKDRIQMCFDEIDEALEGDTTIDTYCSGTTAVTAFKKGEHLIVANLGDSRAIIVTRDDKDELISQQLTVDLKPNLPGEMQRIKSCQGRVMAMEEEPKVYRVWMPDEDCPGLAMARAFGDFCLKDFGLISTPQLFYRRLSDKDEFLILATDGVWDVLSNNQAAAIVASAKKRSMAAKLLVDHAVRAWRYKYPLAKVDDCAVICLFLKRPQPPLLTKSLSETKTTHHNLKNSELGPQESATSMRTDDGLDTVPGYNNTTTRKTTPPQGDPNLRSHTIRWRTPRKYELVQS